MRHLGKIISRPEEAELEKGSSMATTNAVNSERNVYEHAALHPSVMKMLRDVTNQLSQKMGRRVIQSDTVRLALDALIQQTNDLEDV